MNNKGFTIIELLVGFLILALVSGIGIVSYNSITDRVEKNYYETMENELLLAGNEYFSNYRGNKPLTGYNKVDISKLIDNKYIEKLKDTDGKECKVPNNEESSVYIYKNENDYLYEVCLICNDYKSKGNYCGGNVDGVISIKATSNNKEYNPLLSYSNVSWTNNDVTVEFSMPNTVSKYVVINTANNQKRECTASNNTCTMTFSDTSSYMVEAYNDGVKVGTEKDFNIKVDKVAPTFDIDETTELIIEALPLTYSYVNEVKNLKDNLGIKNVIYTLTGNGINETIDITDTTKVNKTLGEGNYKLTVTASDFAGNTTTKTVDFIVKYKYILISKPDTSYCSSPVYDGSSQTLTKTAGTGFSFSNNTGTNAGSYNVNVTLDPAYQWDNYTSDKLTIICSIGKRAVTYKADDATKEYDGTALTKQTATLVSGSLVSGHVASFSISGSITNAGTATNTLDSVTIRNSSGTDVTSNYSITKQNGTLTVNITVTYIDAPTSSSYCKTLTYNGSSQTLTNAAGTGFSFTNNTGTNAGSYTVSAVLNNNYRWSDGTSANKTITCNIEKKLVTYTASSASRAWNGAALTNQTASLTSGSLVSGHTATFTITGSQTSVGSSTNTLNSVTIKSGSTDVSSNYSITKVNGTLTVTTSLSCSISEADSTFTASASGDSGNYQYSWNGGGYSTTKTLARGNATSVNVTVRDTTSGGTATCNMTCTYGTWYFWKRQVYQSISNVSKSTAEANGYSYYRLCTTLSVADCGAQRFSSGCKQCEIYNRNITCS